MKKSIINLSAIFAISLNSSLAQAVKYAGEYSPAWSPDGKYLAYHKNSDEMSWDIVIKDVDTGKVEQITKTDAMDVDASWSPDGSKLVYASNTSGNWDVYLYDLTNKTSKPLITHEAKDIAPKWSPNGKSIMFLSTRNGEQQLFLFDLHSKKIKQLTDTGQDLNHPSWSPDGQSIQFDQYFKYKTRDGGRSKIYQLNINDEKIQHLFSQEGSSIAAKLVSGQLYVSNNQSGNWDIYQVDLDTGKVTPIANTKTNEMKASVDKTGKKMAYSRNNENGVAEITIKSL